MTVCGVSVLKNVVFVVTRKPRFCASLTAATAWSNTPSLHTDSSWRSASPSICTANARNLDGVNLSSFFGSSSAFVHRNTYFLRFISSLTSTSICGCISGSPPAMDTIGAPHSSIAASACSTGMRCFSRLAGCWILPHPAHFRLHANSGSSSTSSGNLERRASFWRNRYVPTRMLWRNGILMLALPPWAGRNGCSQWRRRARLRPPGRARGGPGGEPDRAGPGQPAQLDVLWAVDQVCGRAIPLRHLHQAARVRRVRRPGHQDQVAFARDGPHRELPVGGGVADVVAARAAR